MVWDMFVPFDYFIHLEGWPASPSQPDHLFRKKMNFSQVVELPPLYLVNKLSPGNLYSISKKSKKNLN